MVDLRQKIQSYLKYSAITVIAFILLFLAFDVVIMPLYVQQGQTRNVPSVLGMPIEQARKTLADSGLDFKETEPKSDKQYAIGTVAAQNPPAGAEVKQGRNVYLTVSGGERFVNVPVLRGRSLRDATFTLETSGLTLGNITYQVSLEFPENTIIDQETAPATNVKRGSRISVIVSQGRSADRLPVPKTAGKTLTEAERIIIQAGFNVGNITFQVNLDLLPNTVIDQYPRAGELAGSGTAIDLFVSKRAE